MRLSALMYRIIFAGAATALAACSPDGTAPSALRSASTAPTELAYVRVPQKLLSKDFVRATGFNRDHKRDDVYAFGWLPQSEIDALDQDVQNQVTALDARLMAHNEVDAKSLRVREDRGLRATRAAEAFHNYDQMTTELRSLAAAHPDLVTLNTAGKSVQGRELWYLKIAKNAAQDSDAPKLLYIANMHGDETVGRELMIYLARLLLNGYGTDARMTNIVDHAQVYLMPSMNPDGYELDQRYNADGVDLNRDFPDFTADPHDSTDGRAVETQAIMRLHEQNHFLVAINFHGGEVCFNTPWDTQPNDGSVPKFGDDAFIAKTGRDYTTSNHTIYANNSGSFDHGLTYGYEWYEVDGGMQDWSIYYRNAIHATVELSTTKWPSASNLPRMWDENKESLVKYLESGMTGMHLNVVGSRGEGVPAALVRVGSADRDVKYTRQHASRPAVGGAQTVTVNAPGYKAQTLNLTPRMFDGTFTDVTLTPQ